MAPFLLQMKFGIFPATEQDSMAAISLFQTGRGSFRKASGRKTGFHQRIWSHLGAKFEQVSQIWKFWGADLAI